MKLIVDIPTIFGGEGDHLGGCFHTYNSCTDEGFENAYFNGCPRCTMIAAKIANCANNECDVILVKE